MRRYVREGRVDVPAVAGQDAGVTRLDDGQGPCAYAGAGRLKEALA
jgi:hypothetical protein